MTNIVVLIKQVPDTWSERKLSEDDWTLDREAADAVLDEINERAVEEALLIKEKEGGDSTVTVLTAGPERATEAIRKARFTIATSSVRGPHAGDFLAYLKGRLWDGEVAITSGSAKASLTRTLWFAFWKLTEE